MNTDEQTSARVEPLSRRRSAIARGMKASLAASAQLTCGVRVNLDRVMACRSEHSGAFKEDTGASLSPLAFVARATCLALMEMPLLNANFDVERMERHEFPYVNLGMAVDADDGLVVGNIKNADGMTTGELAVAIAALATKVRSGKVRIEDISGGTFTISNTGSRGSEFDTPILNWPEVGIMAVPVIERRVAWKEVAGSWQCAPEWSTVLCLTYDHQVADGADAARFLQLVGRNLDTWDFDAEVARAQRR